METLQDEVETLTKLFAALETPSEIQESKTEIENNSDNNNAEVIYDFSSDDENPYSNPYKESQNNFGLKRKQSYVEDDYQSQYIYGPPSLEENFLYRQGMVKNKQNKWEKIPPQYIPKLFTFPTNSDILFIDCEQNPEAKVQEWSNKMGIQIQLTKELRNLHPKIFLDYIIHKTQGNAYRFFSSLDETETMMIATIDAMETFKNVLNRLIQEFIRKQIEDKTSQEAFQLESL
uniref:Uncharacterized protein n=1 Tax=Lactuca sativa TaxID=4236 RepID=A0A9R1WR70_LACSA|nr:hypothetical protein LSAT_V11C100033770 [Lactuca sativa]